MNHVEQTAVDRLRVFLGEKLPLDIVTVSTPVKVLIPKNQKITMKHLYALANNLGDFRTTSGNTPIDHKMQEIMVAVALKLIKQAGCVSPVLNYASPVERYYVFYQEVNDKDEVTAWEQDAEFDTLKEAEDYAKEKSEIYANDVDDTPEDGEWEFHILKQVKVFCAKVSVEVKRKLTLKEE
jgi:hypothetical protein